MKKIICTLSVLFILFSCEDFLEVPPTIGLTNDKLTDIQSMQALIYGSYGNARNFVSYQNAMASTMVRDAVVRRSANWVTFFSHQIPNMFTRNMFSSGYKVLNGLNTVSVANMDEMKGTDADKNRILGDLHFLRALVYFDLNNYFTLYSSGYSVPLLLNPIGVNDRVSCNTSIEIIAQIESDIEQARSYFASVSGVANYEIATALAARIYFYHEKYDKAYEMANEVISSGKYLLESDVSAPFNNPNNSSEVIFSINYNASEGNPSNINFGAFMPDEDKGWASLNPYSLVARLRGADPQDKRHSELFTDGDLRIFANGKFPTDQMDYVYIRLAEMYLTRAEANIMRNNSVSSADIADINKIKNRAEASDVVTSMPGVTEVLNILFEERTKELCFEHGDRYLNTRRTQRGIITEDGTGEISYSDYLNLLVFPFPVNEIKIHNLTREP